MSEGRGPGRPKKAHPEDDAPNASFFHRENSPTASTVGSAVQYPESGAQVYRVRLSKGYVAFKDVKARTGDEAAAAALTGQGPEAKVAHVDVAPQELQEA